MLTLAFEFHGNSFIQLDVATWAFIAGTVIPLLVGLATKLNASSRVKATVNLVLTVAAGLCAAATQHEGVLSISQATDACIAAYLASAASYHSFWKPTGAAPAVQAKTANFGLGSAAPAVDQTPSPPGGRSE